MYMYAQKLIGE